MAYPEHFYYTDKRESLSYTDKPQGVLDVSRLIKNKKPWKKASLGSEQKNKSLVVADWTAKGWSRDKINAVQQLLDQLKDDGFSVYVWQDDKVIPRENADFQNIYPAFNSDIAHAAVIQHQLTQDQVLVLDDYELQSLLNHEEQQKTRKLFTSDYVAHAPKSLLPVLKKSTPKLEEIIHNEFSMRVNDAALKLGEVFPELSIKYEYSKLILNQAQLKALLSEEKAVTISGMVFKQEDLLKIEHIWLSGEVTSTDLQLLLSYTPALKTLFVGTLSGQLANTVNLENLEKLSFYKVEQSALHDLWRQAPKLKRLDVIHCENLSAEFIEQLNFTGLEELYLSGISIALDSLFQAIANTTTLKKLGLQRTGGLSDFEEEFTEILDSSNLASLIELDLEYSNISPTFFVPLITNATNLKKLNLSQCFNLSHAIAQPLNLISLEELELRESSISGANLVQLISKASNLKKLNLQLSNGLSDEMALDLELPNLEELELEGSDITLSNLVHLIAKAPKLKKLNLKNCTKLVGEITEDFYLPELIELNLSNTTTSVANLERFLVHAPKLKYLFLWMFNREPENWSEMIETTRFSRKIELPNLEELDLLNAMIPAENLEHLLANATNLKMLRVSGVDAISGNLTHDLKLPCLRKLLLDASHIDFFNLKRLTAEAENLEYLDVKGCESSVVERFISSSHRDLSKLEIEKDEIVFQGGNAVDSAHNLNMFRNYTPSQKDEFQFKGENNTWQQAMVIEKLSQYLTLKKQKEFISKIKDGMCFPMSRYFLDHSLEQWTNFITQVAAWDGRQESLNKNLEHLFDDLFEKYVKKYQENQGKSTYLGDNLSSFLEATKNENGSYLLSNPWHTIGLKYLKDEDLWAYYDPNFVGGFKKLKTSQLDSTVKTYLGSVISVNGDYRSVVKPGINSPSDFMQGGGLFPIKDALNKKDIVAVLPEAKQFSAEDLDGLLLRSTAGKPAWFLALLSDEAIQTYTLALLEAFISFNSGDFAKRLEKSLEVLTWKEKQYCINQLKKLNCDKKELINELCSVLSNVKSQKKIIKDHTIIPAKSEDPRAVEKNEFSAEENELRAWEKELQTWEKQNPYTDTVLGYCQELTRPGTIETGDIKKRLVELASDADVQALQLSLQNHCNSIARPFFYINSPDDLVCSAPFLERQVDSLNHVVTGVIKKGPGGSLHDFLTKQQFHTDNPPVLIVNYGNFDADDIVRFNGLLDKTRYADGTELPSEALVIGLMNVSKPDCYQGSDFYSRFDRVEKCSINSQMLSYHVQKIVPPFLSKKTEADDKTFPINLYEAPDWEDRLLGRWEIRGDNLYFVEGALQQALDSGLPLELQNPPLSDEQFISFWQQACLHGRIEHAGRTIHLPESFHFITSEGYRWDELTDCVTLHASLLADAGIDVLNASRLSEFFKRYECDNETKTLNVIYGLVEAHANQELHVNLTRELSDNEWASLLSACQEYHVHLNVHCAPAVALPVALEEKLSGDFQATILEPTEHNKVLVSTDCDTTIALLVQEDKSWNVIDVSECSSYDLLIHTMAHFDSEHCKIAFHKTSCALLNLLDNNEKVILKGHFSPELIESLEPLLLERLSKGTTSGQLVLISENNPFPYFQSEQHTVTPETKHRSLQPLYTQSELERLSDEELEQEPLAKLKARLNYLRSTPEATSSGNETWEGLHGVSGNLKFHEFQVDKSTIIAQEFNEKRIKAVNQVLSNAPYVFLTGLTAVGKSTFVEENFKTSEVHALYQGESQILDWAIDSSEKRKILFIDEANLSPRQWSEFEGLFNDPPSILIQGQYHLLSENHKVIFAGNPINYGDERKLAPLFERHGNAVVFDPLPPEFIYERILKPIFAETALDTRALCQPILNVYRFLCEHSEDKVLISPRELQMMALLVMAYHQKSPTGENNILAAEHYAYTLAESLVPEKHKKDFALECKPKTKLEQKKAIAQQDDFLITASREHVSQHLSDLLDLRQYRRLAAVNDTQRYGGLGGIILDGEPGIGKSELVVSTLRAHGYEEVHDYKGAINTNKDKPFYRMPVSMQTEDKKELLIKAFHEGAVVVVDEINSSPMMERLLNALLMGKDPQGERPQKPGFMVIGTQNPVTMAGRRAPSTALARRLTTLTLDSYSHEEMVRILIIKGVDSEKAANLVYIYEHQLKRAKNERLSPAPTFRDLLKIANRAIYPEVKALYEYINHLSQEDEKQPQELAKNLARVMRQFLLARAEGKLGELESLREQFIQIIKKNYDEMKGQNAPAWKPLLDTIATDGLLFQEESILNCSLVDETSQNKAIIQPILKTYRFLLEQSESKDFILPHSLRMVVPLAASWKQQNPEGNLLAAADHYAYYMSKTKGDLYWPSFDEQFKPQAELEEPTIGLVKLIKPLYAHLDALAAYGKKLVEGQTVTPQEAAEGRKAQEFARKLSNIATGFIAVRAEDKDSERLDKLRKEFAQTINEGYKELSVYRASWKPILANIAIAATGIGLLVMTAKWLLDSKGSRTFGFFSETSAQKKLKDIKQAHNDLDEQSPPSDLGYT